MKAWDKDVLLESMCPFRIIIILQNTLAYRESKFIYDSIILMFDHYKAIICVKEIIIQPATPIFLFMGSFISSREDYFIIWNNNEFSKTRHIFE